MLQYVRRGSREDKVRMEFWGWSNQTTYGRGGGGAVLT